MTPFDALNKNVLVLVVLADGACHAAVFHLQLHAGGVVEELRAGLGQALGDDERGGVVVALHMEVGVRAEVDVVAVVRQRGLMRLGFHAALGGLVGPPREGLLGVVGPHVHEVAVGAVVAFPVDEAHARLHGGLVGSVEVDRGGHVAGGLRRVDVLDACDVRAGFERRVDG